MILPVRKARQWVAAAVVFLLLVPGVASQEKTVLWDFSLEPKVARRGELVTVHLSAQPQAGWYLYSHTLKAVGPQPTEFRFDLPGGVRALGAIEAPIAEKKFDQGFQAEVEIYRGAVVFDQKLLVGDEAAAEPLRIQGTVRFQVCSETSCLPPKTLPFDLELTVEDGAARENYRAPAGILASTEQPPPAPPPPAAGDEARAVSPTAQALGGALRAGFFAFLFFAIVQGFLALLTPCVYPMIPITVSFFIKQGEQERRRPFMLASTYALSIIVTFTLVGLLVTAVYGPAGVSRLGTHPVANLFLALLFIVFALSLFGLYEIRVPASLQSYFASKGRGGGYGGTMFMGVAFTLASLACTAPFIGALLGLAAAGEWFWPLVGMLGFAFAFSLPFFFLALFPQFLARMPKSGGWLNSVKVVIGFLILGASLKFLSNTDVVWNWGAFTRPVVLASWSMMAVFTGLYLLGKIPLPHDSPLQQIGVLRMLLSLAFLTFGLYLATGLFGATISGAIDAFLPASVVSTSGGPQRVVGRSSLEWLEDYDRALERARAQRKPILIDFTGYTCTNCHWMERNILARGDVERVLKRFVLVRLYTDGGPNRDENQRMQMERFGTPALPLYVITSPQDRELARLEGLTRNPARYLAFLDEGLARFAAVAN